MVRVLVTGCSGFIGKHLCKKLISNGHEVIGFDKLRSEYTKVVGNLLNIHEIDLAFTIFPADIVIHLAAFVNVPLSQRQPFNCYDDNVVASLNLFKIMHKHNCNRIVFASSGSVYGSDIDTKSTELDKCFPKSVYAHSKKVTENVLEGLHQSLGWYVTILRFFNVAGGHDIYNSHLIPNIIKSETAKVYGNTYPTPDGTAVRNFVHVDDISRAILVVLNANGYNTYNLCSQHNYSVMQIVDKCVELRGLNLVVKLEDKRDGDAPYSVGNGSKFQEEYSFTYVKSIEDIIHDSN